MINVITRIVTFSQHSVFVAVTTDTREGVNLDNDVGGGWGRRHSPGAIGVIWKFLMWDGV